MKGSRDIARRIGCALVAFALVIGLVPIGPLGAFAQEAQSAPQAGAPTPKFSQLAIFDGSPSQGGTQLFDLLAAISPSSMPVRNIIWL